MDLNEINVFVKVAQAGSFTRAARELGIPNSTASARVSALERRLGVTLLQRTTRKLRMTEEGEAYARRAAQGLYEIARAESEVSLWQSEPQGILRVTTPIGVGTEFFANLVANFRKKYPKVSVEVLFADRTVDLVAEGIDVAIRAGGLKDSGLIARQVGTSVWAPVASPAYIKRCGMPSHPKDLREHACLQFTPLGADQWELTDGKHTVIVPLARQLAANEINFVKALALSGNGVALLNSHLCSSEIARGKLVRLLPAWHATVTPVYLVYPGQKFVPPKVRAFLDMAQIELKRLLQD
jgi:DNA-binding transcriptional LysR family regulator